jgi:hypothetical protein
MPHKFVLSYVRQKPVAHSNGHIYTLSLHLHTTSPGLYRPSYQVIADRQRASSLWVHSTLALVIIKKLRPLIPAAPGTYRHLNEDPGRLSTSVGPRTRGCTSSNGVTASATPRTVWVPPKSTAGRRHGRSLQQRAEAHRHKARPVTRPKAATAIVKTLALAAERSLTGTLAWLGL